MNNLKKDPLPTALVGAMTTKLDERIAFFGMTDELSCHLMKVRCLVDSQETKDELEWIVKTLSAIMGETAGSKFCLGDAELSELLRIVKKYEQNNGILTTFVLPGQNIKSADIHIARTVSRRAELAYAAVYAKYGGNDYTFEFFNKISTFLYALALSYEK